MAGEAYARQHVGLEHAQPVLVGNCERILDLEDADVVDQDVDLAGGLDDGGDAGCSRHVARCGDQLRVCYGGKDFGDRCLDIGGLAAVDRHLGATRREFLRHGQADTFCRTGDQRTQSRQIDLHAVNSRDDDAGFEMGSVLSGGKRTARRPSCTKEQLSEIHT